ncbi:TetR/AcrR family transcriptional regulator C-terminal ligand-binding domain-containing protein [Paenibacillus sp. MWE-103]|uniref:TetR/AcrR family transcriptional regulator C-terminal ligand-binding domain-containing protein n=2 Tax=Paenibacillus artemisiicola TaxID=1172618 RepID=A0ABS3WFK3_9BACL|nr:TetR/AcrR family transcriptional regulator C-terminal ligand-binding domain-containing protein [Paenibacillus artemisiicola]
MAEAQLDASFAVSFRETFIASRRDKLYQLLKRGIARGEIPEETDFELFADLCYGPIWYRLLNGHASPDNHFVQTLLDYIL